MMENEKLLYLLVLVSLTIVFSVFVGRTLSNHLCGWQTLGICAFIFPSCAMAIIDNQSETILVHLASMGLKITINILLQEPLQNSHYLINFTCCLLY